MSAPSSGDAHPEAIDLTADGTDAAGVDEPPVSRPAPAAMSVLGLVALLGEASGYDLRKLGEGSLRYFLGLPSPAQIYSSLSELERRALLAERVEHTGRRERRVFTLTSGGDSLLEDWLTEEAPDASFDFPLGLRMMLGRRASHEALVRSVEAHRDICDLVIETIEGAQAADRDRDPYMAIMLDWGLAFFVSEAARTSEAMRRLDEIPAEQRRST